MKEYECVCVHGLSIAVCGALGGGEGQGMLCWRRGCKQLSLKGVKTAQCTRRSLGEECNVTQGTGQLCP